MPRNDNHLCHGFGIVEVSLIVLFVFDVQDDDIYSCTGDIGWVTGHSYVVYGPLLRGVTSLMYGAPDQPAPDRWWDMIERHGVTILYSTPTSIRMHMKNGEEWVRRHDLSTLRLLGSVGEPINPEARQSYEELKAELKEVLVSP